MLDAIIPLISLISLEVILGIDNVIFISILSDKLPDSQRNKLRYWGLGLAMVMRLILLTLISWILKLDQELFILFDIHFSGKGLILIAGGLFLIYKSTVEIYHKTEALQSNEEIPLKKASFQFRQVHLHADLLENKLLSSHYHCLYSKLPLVFSYFFGFRQ